MTPYNHQNSDKKVTSFLSEGKGQGVDVEPPLFIQSKENLQHAPLLPLEEDSIPQESPPYSQEGRMGFNLELGEIRLSAYAESIEQLLDVCNLMVEVSLKFSPKDKSENPLVR
ncbi:MAG TPA: hypothetical protein DHU69_06530 [Deltaproteobacteria bacterium]|nr:hypothetical protein [Deltaproteobacteria bacterium]